MEKNKTFLSNKFLDWSRDITSLANPLILVFISFVFLGNSSNFYTLLLALLANEIIASAIKIVFPKKRPNNQTYNTLLEKIDAGSFPSLHTSRITLTYLSLLSETTSTTIKVVFIIAIILVILSRIILKKHYWMDVFGGFILGFLLWCFMVLPYFFS